MICLVVGGAASGKSRFAERLCLRLGEKRCCGEIAIKHTQTAQGKAKSHSVDSVSNKTALRPEILYIAAMEAVGEEAAERVRRHRRQRRGMGMRTLERPRDLMGLTLPRSTGVALLECAGTLLANEMFLASGLCAHGPDRTLEGILHLAGQAKHLVVVSNDIFAGSERYRGEMAAYLDGLGRINRELASRGSLVVEVVSGVPLVLKGTLPTYSQSRN